MKCYKDIEMTIEAQIGDAVAVVTDDKGTRVLQQTHVELRPILTDLGLSFYRGMSMEELGRASAEAVDLGWDGVDDGMVSLGFEELP